MKAYIKEIIILLLQLFMFYIFPMCAGPTDVMGMVLLIILATFVLSMILGCFLKSKIRFCYPIIVAILFVPSVYIYYNETALVHAEWYFVVSAIGLVVGTVIRLVVDRIKN